MVDVWKIGVEIALANKVSPVLAVIAQDLLGLDSKFTGVIAKWDQLTERQKAATKAAGSLGLGIAIGEGMKVALEAGAQLVKTQGQLLNLGQSQLDIQKQVTAAVDAQAKVHGTTAAGNLKALREFASITPSVDDSIAVLPDMLKLGIVIANLKGGNAEDYIGKLLKTAELRGDGIDPITHQLNPQRLLAGAKAETAAIVASGGLVGPDDLYGLVKQAGPMARMVTDPLEFWSNTLSAAIDMGGQRAGTGETALGRQLLGGKMSWPTAEEMGRLGLLKEGMYYKSGTGTTVEEGGLTGEDILKGPGGIKAWMDMVLMPSMKSNGYSDNNAMMQEFYRLWGTETSRRMAALYTQGKAQVDKDAGLTKAAYGQDLYGNVMGTDLGANTSGLSGAFKGLFEVLGSPLVRPAIAGINSLTSAVSGMATFAQNHQNLTNGLAVGAGVTSAAATGYGVWNLGKLLLTGGGLTASATALNTSAALLGEAAVSLGAKGAIGGLGGLGGGAGLAAGGLLAKLFPATAIATTVWAIGEMVPHADWLDKSPAEVWPKLFGAGHSGYVPPGQMRDPASAHAGYIPPGMVRGADGRPDAGSINIQLPPQKETITITSAPVMLDGRVIGQIISKALVKGASIVSSAAGFDTSAAPQPSGSGW